MSTHEISLIAIDIRKWDLETQKLALTSYFVLNNEEQSGQFEISILQPPDMVEEFLGKLKYTVAKSFFETEEAPEIEIESESFLRQKLYNYFRKILMELNNPRRKKGQPKMIYSTHMDVYNENQDISFLPKEIQFFVILNWARRYYEREDYQKAIEPLKKLLKLKPDFGLGYKWLARSLKKIRKFEEAMRMYEKYAEVDDSLDAWLDLAKSYRKGKLFDKSEKIYHDILEKYPGDKEARIGLAQIKYARKEPDYIEILDELHQEDPEWLKEWLTEEFNFRIYVPEKSMLSPLQAAKFLGYEKVLDLTQRAFKNEVPSHFNPAKARLTFYKEELENWAFVMNRYNTLGQEVKLYPDALGTLTAAANSAPNAEAQVQDSAATNTETSDEGEKPRKLTRVEEILMKIRARREELGLPEPVKRRRGRPRKNPVENSTPETTTAEAPVPSSPEESEPAEDQPKRRRGRPRKSETQPAEPAASSSESVMAPEESAEAQPKRRRGRPRKTEVAAESATVSSDSSETEEPPKRRRGRPRKTETTTEASATADATAEQPVKRRRGRPRKSETLAEDTAAAAEVPNASSAEDTGEPPKRRRGRPRKTEITSETQPTGNTDSATEEQPKRRRGRPRKTEVATTDANNNDTTATETPEEAPKRRRGRPPKKKETDNSNGKPDTIEISEMPDTSMIEE